MFVGKPRTVDPVWVLTAQRWELSPSQSYFWTLMFRRFSSYFSECVCTRGRTLKDWDCICVGRKRGTAVLTLQKLRLRWILPSFGLLRGVRWFQTDVSGLHIGPKEFLKIGPIHSSETSVPNHPTPRNDPEDRRIQFTATQAWDHS
jgi:hypothetical protein